MSRDCLIFSKCATCFAIATILNLVLYMWRAQIMTPPLRSIHSHPVTSYLLGPDICGSLPWNIDNGSATVLFYKCSLLCNSAQQRTVFSNDPTAVLYWVRLKTLTEQMTDPTSRQRGRPTKTRKQIPENNLRTESNIWSQVPESIR
jgi:hypothetical protein